MRKCLAASWPRLVSLAACLRPLAAIAASQNASRSSQQQLKPLPKASLAQPHEQIEQSLKEESVGQKRVGGQRTAGAA